MCHWSNDGHFHRDTFICDKQVQLNRATTLLWNITESQNGSAWKATLQFILVHGHFSSSKRQSWLPRTLTWFYMILQRETPPPVWGLDASFPTHSLGSTPSDPGQCWPDSAQWFNPPFWKSTLPRHLPTGAFMKMNILSALIWHFTVANSKGNFQCCKIIFLSCNLSCRAPLNTLVQHHWFQLRFSKALESAHITQTTTTTKPMLERFRLSIMMKYNKWRTQWHFILIHTCNCQGSVTWYYRKVMWVFWKA